MQTMKTWAPAITGMLCLALGPGLIGIYGFFVEPLSREFGVGVAVLNIGPVALILVPGIIAPMIGKLADRLPIRGLLLAGATFAMFSLFAIGLAPTLVSVALGFLCFSIGLTLYGPIVVNGLMVKLYPGREARALAVAAIGISVASATLPPLVGNLMAHLDWRLTLQILSIGLLIALWLVILSGVPRGVVGSAPGIEASASKAFYREPAFWLIGFCVALGLNVLIVLAVCYPPYFTGQGYSVADAGWFLAIMGLAGLVGKSGLAWCGDAMRHYVKWLAVVLLLLQTAGLGMLLVAEGVTGIIAALCLLGFGSGAFIPMHPYLNSRYFDATIISQVTGAQMPLFLPFGLVGAPLAGYVYDQTGSYDLVFTALAATLCIAALLVLRLPKQNS
jgi:predicted MFS family arabinose efflux permease